VKPAHGFSLIELLVALVVFAALAAAAYGGLAAIARTRGALAVQQDRFGAIVRSVSALERDLRQAVARPVRGNDNAVLPALVGNPDNVEFTRLGFANPRAEPRSNLERVVYALDGSKLRRGRYAVLDRAPNSAPATTELLDRVGELHLRYFGVDGIWRDTWPPAPVAAHLSDVPRAIEFRFVPAQLGEIRRIVELPSALPDAASTTAPNGDQPPSSHDTRPTGSPPSAGAP
jgi:general secretion pathway protein J